MNRLFLILIGFTFFMSCNKNDDVQDIDTKNRVEIEKYIADHNLNASSTGSGLYYVIDNLGTGPRPNASSDVTVKYKGYLTNGSIFDQNDQGFTTNLQNVIPGWTEGIQLFKEGGNGKLLIPSKLGYGSANLPGIPPNSVLIFDIELIKVYP